MEVIVNHWNNEAEKEVEEVGFLRKRVLQHSSSDKDIEGEGVEFVESNTTEILDVVTTQVNAQMILKHKELESGTTILPASNPSIPDDSAPSLYNVTTTTEIRTVSTVKEIGEGRQELYLERVYEKPATHGFYCPNCKSCIQTVYIIKEVPKQPDPIRCSSCFSFLIPIGSWLGLVSEENGALNDQETGNNRLPEQSHTLRGTLQHKDPEPDSGKKLTVIEDVVQQNISSEVKDEVINGTDFGNNVASQDSLKHSIATSQDHEKGQIAPLKKKYFWSSWAVIGDASSEASILKIPKAKTLKTSDWKVISDAPSKAKLKEQPELNLEIKVDGGSAGQTRQSVVDESTPLLPSREPLVVAASSKRLEILKSVVYGGLNESLASLSVVTSAASAEATTLNIVALAIANLIGGLFALGHNLGELKSEKSKRPENQTEAQVDRYNELLGQRENFFLHAFIAILSFIVFGLVPPVVYGFSFRESDNKDFKLATVAGASLLCVALLSIAKAHTQRSNNYVKYFQTVFYYLSTGAVATVLSYLAGQLANRVMEKLGWFEPPSNFSMHASGMSVQAWSSY